MKVDFVLSLEDLGIKKNQLDGVIIGIDVDAVCADHNEEFKKYVAEDLGVNPKELGDVKDWDYASWGIDREDFLRIHPDAVRRGMFRDLKPMPGVTDSIKALVKAGAKIRIITHRLYVDDNHQEAVTQTAQWLDINDIPYHDLCMIEQKSHVNADIYIDDSPTNVKVLREQTGKPVIVFDQLYNRDVQGLRVKQWSEIPAIVVRETGRTHHGKQQQFEFDSESDPFAEAPSRRVKETSRTKSRLCGAPTLAKSFCRRPLGADGTCPNHGKRL